MVDTTFAQQLRIAELKRIVNHIPAGARILEIGAGAGWQAKLLADMGFNITAIDIAKGRYRSLQVWPVQTYDGKNLPFSSQKFDVVFSSSVLEHVHDIDYLLNEISRVLTPEGIAIHVLPTSTWRLWTTLSHYPSILKAILNRGEMKDTYQNTSITSRYTFISLVFRALFPHRHGETGNSISELYHFSHYRWLKLFRRLSWSLQAYEPCHIFYSGNSLFGNKIPIHLRQQLTQVLGSSTIIYVLKK